MARHVEQQGRRGAAEGLERIARELNEERAAALRRISETLESLIEKVQAARERVDAAAADERAGEVARYRELRRKALQYRWYLEVQREAIGLRQHQRLDEFYRVPDEIPDAAM